MDTFAYLHLIQDYEDTDSPQLLEPFDSLKQIRLSNPAKLGLMGILWGACSVAISNPVQATEPFRASYAGGGYFYIFSGTCTSDCPTSEPISVNPAPSACTSDCPTVQPICEPNCSTPQPVQPVSVNPAPSACTLDCPIVQPICEPDCSGYTPISPPPILRYGSVGADVRALQIALHELGCYQGPIDGAFGKATHHAVIRFQRDHGLIPDGIVGSSTAQILGLA